MSEILAMLQIIGFALVMMLLFKDMSGKDELNNTRGELKRIADALERGEQDGE